MSRLTIALLAGLSVAAVAPTTSKTTCANIRDFGVAEAGTGAANCTAFQSAITYAAASNPKREVCVPGGTYALSPVRTDARFYDGGSGDYLFCVNVPTGVLIRGEGRSSSFYLAGGGDHADGPFGPGASPPFYYPIILECSDCGVKDVRFYGDNGASDGTGFNLKSTWKVISTIGATGSNIQVAGSYFENLYGVAWQAGPMSSTVTRATYSGNFLRWCAGMNPTGRGITIANNDAHSCAQLEIEGYQGIIAGNKFSGAYNFGLSFDGDNTQVVDNNIDMSLVMTPSVSGTAGAILIRGARGAVVSGNTIKDSPANGIQVIYDSNNARFPTGNTISNNTILTDRTVAVAASTGIGINVSQADNTTISGNVVDGRTGAGFVTLFGIYINNSTNTTISGGAVMQTGIGCIALDASVVDTSITGVSLDECGPLGLSVGSGNSYLAVTGLLARGAATTDIIVNSGATFVRLISNQATTVSLDGPAIASAQYNSWQDTTAGQGIMVMTGTLVGSASGATATYLMNSGLSSVTPLRYQTGGRTFGKMRATLLAQTMAVSCTVTLMKGNAAQSQGVSFASTDPDMTIANNTTAVDFGVGDDFDVRVSASTDSSAGVCTVSVMLEP